MACGGSGRLGSNGRVPVGCGLGAGRPGQRAGGKTVWLSRESLVRESHGLVGCCCVPDVEAGEVCVGGAAVAEVAGMRVRRTPFVPGRVLCSRRGGSGCRGCEVGGKTGGGSA